MQEVKAGLCIEMVDVHQPDEIGPEGWVPGSSQGSQGHEKTWGWQGPRSWQLSRVLCGMWVLNSPLRILNLFQREGPPSFNSSLPASG